MKNLILLCFLSIFLSCSSNDEKVYSKDPQINQWAKTRVDDFQDLSYESFIQIDGEKQRAAFRALSPENKLRLWNNKADILLKNSKNQIEKELFSEFKSFFINFNFEKRFTEDELNFLNSLVSKGKEKLKWDEAYVVLTFGTLDIYKKDKYDYPIFSEINFARDKAQIADDQPTCNCKWGWCGVSSGFECKAGCENDGGSGCGFLFFQECTGSCKYTGKR